MPVRDVGINFQQPAVFAKDGLVDELKKALANRVLNAEMDDHLDGEAAGGKANRRNGYSAKTVIGETGKLELRIPRDREGTFDLKLIAKYQRRFPGFDAKIISIPTPNLEQASDPCRHKFDRAFMEILVERLTMANIRLSGV